jgi:hypothetical protein
VSHIKSMFVYGGIAGLLSSLCYALLFTAPLEYVRFPVTATQLQIVIYYWTGPLVAVFGIVNSFCLYRILATERQGSLNRLAYLFSIIAFSFLAAMLLIQETLRITISDRFVDAGGSADQDLYRSIFLALDGLDLGVDLAWDLFLSVSLILTGFVMLRHSRFRVWFGIPSIACGLLLLLLNGITAPFPPNTRGLFDAGPLVGLYSFVLSIYMILVGFRIEMYPLQNRISSN